MIGTYNPWLVLLSTIVAVNASFVALALASRIVAAQGRRTEWYWLGGGAISMGTGIWAMHFIGMLAFRLPIAISFDAAITLLSLLVAVLGSGIALFFASRATLRRSILLVSGLLMSAGIASMHYIGMAAMRMDPPIQYSPVLVGLSILVAAFASVVAVWAAFRLRMHTILTAFWKKAGSALVMGGGICGMHYTGMAAASFAPNSICTVVPQNINQPWLGGTVGAIALLLLILTLGIAAFDSYVSALLEAKVSSRTAALDRMSVELRRLSHRLADIQDEERRGLASELHDIVGQNLSALSAEIAMIRDRLPAGVKVQLADRLASASGLAKASVEAIRRVMSQLRPPGLDELGLPGALRWHADEFQSRTGIAVTLAVDESLPRPLPRVEDALLRITMEVLNNVAKHSGARSVRLTLQARNDDVVLEIVDDGRGFDPENLAPRSDSSGWGLMIMKERASAAGAELRIVSVSDAGTRVEVRISNQNGNRRSNDNRRAPGG